MPDETPDQPGPPLAMPEDSLKSWNADESELLSSLNREPPETTPAPAPAPEAAGESLFGVPMDPDAGQFHDALTMRRILGKGGFGEVDRKSVV